MSYHAKLSPSGASRWSVCTASPGEEAGKPNEGNDASRWGTANHLVSSTCLTEGMTPDQFAGWTVSFIEGEGETLDPDEHENAEYRISIDDEQIDCSTKYVNFVRELKLALDAEMHVEQAVPIDHITGESEATGTADVVLMPRVLDTLVVIDLKGGMYRVDAMRQVTFVEPITGTVLTRLEPNLQLAMYASGAIRKFDSHHRYKHVKLIVVQPRLHHVSEFTLSVEALASAMKSLKASLAAPPVYKPSFETCHYCKGKATCGAFQAMALDTVFEDQTLAKIRDVPRHELGDLFDKLDMIELWCSSIRALVHKELSEHRPVKGLKMTMGRLGNRKWSDTSRVAELLTRDFGLPETLVTTKKVVGPAAIEKLATGKKKRINEFQWSLIQGMITQEQGKPVVVREDDPRPALPSPEGAFTDLSVPSTFDPFN